MNDESNSKEYRCFVLPNTDDPYLMFEALVPNVPYLMDGLPIAQIYSKTAAHSEAAGLILINRLLENSPLTIPFTGREFVATFFNCGHGYDLTREGVAVLEVLIEEKRKSDAAPSPATGKPRGRKTKNPELAKRIYEMQKNQALGYEKICEVLKTEGIDVSRHNAKRLRNNHAKTLSRRK